MKHGKHYVDSAKLLDRTKLYDTEEAMDLCCKTAKAKFDETVELHVRLGVDSRHADQQVRGAIVLPHGTGKNVRVIAICKGDAAKAAEAAGAMMVGDSDLIAKIQNEGFIDFDGKSEIASARKTALFLLHGMIAEGNKINGVQQLRGGRRTSKCCAR